jgi:hypothetical protein
MSSKNNSIQFRRETIEVWKKAKRKTKIKFKEKLKELTKN